MGTNQYTDGEQGVPYPEAIGTPDAPRPDAEAVASAGSWDASVREPAYGNAAERYAKLAKLGEKVLEILATQYDLASDGSACPDNKFRTHWNLGRIEGAAHVLGLYNCVTRKLDAEGGEKL